MKLSDSEIVEIYGASWCDYCQKAKTLCEDEGVLFSYVDVEVEETLDEKFNSSGTLPQIFVDNNFIGGYTELKQLVD